MISLFKRLKELIFRNAGTKQANGFFQGMTPEELEHLKNKEPTYNTEFPHTTNKTEE